MLTGMKAFLIGAMAATAMVASVAASADQATDLRGAVYYDDVGAVVRLLDRGVDVDSRAAGGFTPLMTAVGGSNADLVRLLLERGANPTLENDYGYSVLELAKLRNHPEIVRLIETALTGGTGAGAAVGGTGQAAAATPPATSSPVEPMALYGAVWGEDIDAVHSLLSAGADPNEVNTAGMTPLIAAVRYHNAVLAKMLLDAGADPDIKDNYGRSARDYAQMTTSAEIRSMLNVAATSSNDADRNSPHYSYCQDMYMKDYNLCGSGNTICRLGASRHYEQCLVNGTWY